MPDFEDITVVNNKLTDAQEVEVDNRQYARDAHLFLDKGDGQWDPYFLQQRLDTPCYTIDQTSPIVDQIAGEMAQADFDIQVRPSGGDASKEDAKILDGLVRNIENVSNATHVFNHAARNMITAGIDGWRVATRHINDDSFDQDLMIEPLHNFVDRVWFDPNAELQDQSDATYVYVLQSMGKDEYGNRFPDGSGQSVGDDKFSTAYYHKKEAITVGQIYYIEMEDADIVKMNNGTVYEDNDDLKKITKELKKQGVVETDRRTIKKKVVYSRLFDGVAFLTEKERTVFSWLPVIPTFANFKVFENKVLYHGVVKKLMDAQRVLNYSVTTFIEQVALAPRQKIMATDAMIAGYEEEWSTLNTNRDPRLPFNWDEDAPGVVPTIVPAPQANPGLQVITEMMSGNMNKVAGMFAANMGENPGLQSGVAIKQLQDKGDTGTIKFFDAQEIAICQTAKIIIDAIPKVYDARRQVRILGEDGSFSMTVLNDVVIDEETGEEVLTNDLSKGKYDVTCSSGPSFQNRQQEAVSGMLEVAQVVPGIMETGQDIFLNNINSPGMDQLSERARLQLFNAGQIPPEQMTEEEKAKTQAAQQAAAQQGQQPTPEELIGQAELIKAQDAQKETEVSIQEKSARIQLDANKEKREDRKQAFEEQKFQFEVQQSQSKFALDAQNQQVTNALNANKQQMDELASMFKNYLTATQAVKTTREAAGVDVIMGPGVVENFKEGSDIVSDIQERVEIDN